MIVELKPDDFPRVLPLYRAACMCFPLISAVIQQRQRGQVFVDEPKDPASAIVVTNFGFLSFLGVERNEPFDCGLVRLLATAGAVKPSYLLWYSPPANWRKKLDALVPDVVKRRERARFEFRQGRASWLSGAAECHAGFELKKLSMELIPKTEKFGIRLDSRFWASASDCLANGVGVCLVKDDEVVSICYAAAIVDGLAEVDIVTHPEFRGRGLANSVAQQFIRECLSRGIIPTWDCFVSNVGSMRLAEKLEFIQVNSYPFYSFNVPIEVTGAIDQA